MDLAAQGVLFAVFIFGGMLCSLEVGRRWGRRRLAEDPGGAETGLGAIDGAVFALLGLLLAFTFSGAADRFDTRRSLIVEEVNNMGTAWLRIDLLPADSQPALREAFRHYLDSRLEVYSAIEDVAATRDAVGRSNAIQAEIWALAIAASKGAAPPSAPMLRLPALNDMFDQLLVDLRKSMN